MTLLCCLTHQDSNQNQIGAQNLNVKRFSDAKDRDLKLFSLSFEFVVRKDISNYSHITLQVVVASYITWGKAGRKIFLMNFLE